MNLPLQMLASMFLGQMVANERMAYERSLYPQYVPPAAPMIEEPQYIPSPDIVAEATRRLDAGEFITPEGVMFMAKHSLLGDHFGHLSRQQHAKLQQRMHAIMMERAS